MSGLRLGVCVSTVAAGSLAATPPASAQAQTDSATGRSAALSALFNEIRDDQLKTYPEFASTLGDRRYNDQLSDLSPAAFNRELGRRRVFLTRLLAIDTTGLSDQDKRSSELLEQELIADEANARLKEWELPITQTNGIHTDLLDEIKSWPFESVKDYDDYVARLKAVPVLLRQATENLLAGIEDHRVEPAALIEKALKQTEEIAAEPPETSSFASPLKSFPASIDPATRKRISADVLDAISSSVLPAYVRFANFLRAQELPAARDQSSVQAGTDPSTAPPETASGYKLRQAKIVAMRAHAQDALGPKFNLDAFHDMVLASFALPPDALQQRVDAWIATRKDKQ